MRNRNRPLTVTDRWFGSALVVLLVGFVVAVLMPAEAGGPPAVASCEAMVMRQCTIYLEMCTGGDPAWPRSIAELAYDGVFDFENSHPPLKIDASGFRVGKYAFDDISHQRMSREELLAEIVRVSPPAWQRLGPITLCLDARVYGDSSPRDGVIVGMLKNYPGTKRGKRVLQVANSCGSIQSANGLGRDVGLGRVLTRSIAYYESIGIPMPEEMVKELREAMEGK